jgi:hypothetical protein
MVLMHGGTTARTWPSPTPGASCSTVLLARSRAGRCVLRGPAGPASIVAVGRSRLLVLLGRASFR